MTHQFVVARYNEDLDWLSGFSGQDVVVYDKGAHVYPLPRYTSYKVVELINTGREAATYLSHIILSWYRLADFTVFLQGDPFPHLYGFPPTGFLQHDKGFLAPLLLSGIREWGPDGCLSSAIPNYQTSMAAGLVRRSPDSFTAWWQRCFQARPPEDGICYVPGACFGVSKELIQRRPLDFYKRLIERVNRCSHPEEAYYLERAWLYIFDLQPRELFVNKLALPNGKGGWAVLPGTNVTKNLIVERQEKRV